jgi:hypothetical protein
MTHFNDKGYGVIECTSVACVASRGTISFKMKLSKDTVECATSIAQYALNMLGLDEFTCVCDRLSYAEYSCVVRFDRSTIESVSLHNNPHQVAVGKTEEEEEEEDQSFPATSYHIRPSTSGSKTRRVPLCIRFCLLLIVLLLCYVSVSLYLRRRHLVRK